MNNNEDVKIAAEEEEANRLGLGDEVTEMEDGNVEVPVDQQLTAWQVWTTPTRVGLPLTYFAVGIIYGGQSNVLYPIYTLALLAPSNYKNAVANLTTIFWGYKIFYGFFEDSFPIRGFARKYYIVIGMLLSAMSTILQAVYVTATSTQTVCFFDRGDGSFAHKLSNTSDCTALGFNFTGDNTVTPVYYQANTVARSFDGNIYAVLMTLTNFFYMIADIGADGLAISWARREPLNKRGQIQGYDYMIRFIASILTGILSGVALNTPMFRGDKSYGLTIAQYLWILAVAQALCVPFFFLLQEEKVDPKTVGSFTSKLSDAFHVTSTIAFAAMMVFNIWFNIFGSIFPYAYGNLQAVWVNASAAQSSWANVFVNFVIAVVLWFQSKYLTGYNWRILQCFGLIVSAIMGLQTLLIVYDVTRDPAFWIFTQIDSTAIQLFGFVCTIWATVEMAPPGLEATAISLMTTAANAGQNMAFVISNILGAKTGPNLNDPGDPAWLTSEGQNQYAKNIAAVLGLNLLAPLAIWLMPSNKAQARQRVKNWGENRNVGIATTILTFGVIVYGTATTVYNIVCPCSEFVGGLGCNGDCANSFA